MGDEEIELNSHEDIDDLVPIPRVSEKPLDSLDCISKTFKMTITYPLFDFDSKFTLNSDNPIFGIHNEESDEFKMETIMDEILSSESKVHIEVLSVLWENRLPIPDGSLPLSRYKGLKTKQNRYFLGDFRADLILANVSVFTPKPSMHYFNIIKKNVVKVSVRIQFLAVTVMNALP
ncbi:hypothetical protein Tco_1041911 [Tanacetum coccineum]|uniref:Uncharacterized protein n=1 Tax=Tanacetum coccineum TaxID=301880 RepID=A0ABQ5GI16_9ASTR